MSTSETSTEMPSAVRDLEARKAKRKRTQENEKGETEK
jgi:hypothetical protein